MFFDVLVDMTHSEFMSFSCGSTTRDFNRCETWLNTRPLQYYAIEFFNANEWCFNDNAFLTADDVYKWWKVTYPNYGFSYVEHVRLREKIAHIVLMIYFYNSDRLPF